MFLSYMEKINNKIFTLMKCKCHEIHITHFYLDGTYDFKFIGLYIRSIWK